MNFSIQSLYSWYRNTLRNPKYRWWVIFGTIAYLISPIDIAPDFIPVIGQIDDVLLLTLLVSEVSGLVVDGWKAKKGNVETSTNEPTSTDNTVDVDAVSVK
ncbi:YkvA family protein [Anabaena cylindrica UHCC 0172]|uniref:YkvA family protein n=1 Tax=Anabaena cylindrica TaxID=1165 RepID=UPI002B21E740|nr:YkvA family protein [Anabaena cylindrica]MEA5551815.1 YkvA family protein [Anabaena cylindrica UHCC 0172]